MPDVTAVQLIFKKLESVVNNCSKTMMKLGTAIDISKETKIVTFNNRYRTAHTQTLTYRL